MNIQHWFKKQLVNVSVMKNKRSYTNYFGATNFTCGKNTYIEISQRFNMSFGGTGGLDSFKFTAMIITSDDGTNSSECNPDLDYEILVKEINEDVCLEVYNQFLATLTSKCESLGLMVIDKSVEDQESELT